MDLSVSYTHAGLFVMGLILFCLFAAFMYVQLKILIKKNTLPCCRDFTEEQVNTVCVKDKNSTRRKRPRSGSQVVVEHRTDKKHLLDVYTWVQSQRRKSLSDGCLV